LLGLVIAGEAVDAGFDEDGVEFRALILAVSPEVLTDRNGHFYECQGSSGILGDEAYQDTSVRQSKDRGEKMEDGWEEIEGRTLSLENTGGLVTCHEADLGDAVRVTKGGTDLGRGEGLSSNFEMCSTASCGAILNHDGGARR